MTFTISFHNGHTVARGHNRRLKKIIEREDGHIDTTRMHKTWLDVHPRDAYARIFGDAVTEYNRKCIDKGHKERQIEDYYSTICKDKQKHAVYESIVSIGNYNHHPDEATSVSILKEFCKKWRERNPNLVPIGMYLHLDEATPHVHIDYICVARGYKKGLEVQSSMTGALKNMGYESERKGDTAQIRWERAERQALEDICVAHGLEIEHPEISHKKHMNISEFRQMKRVEELTRTADSITADIEELKIEHDSIIDDINELHDEAVELAYDIVEEHEAAIDRIRVLER